MIFKPITLADMCLIWPYLKKAPGRTTDFSYGGVLMWVDYFNYAYCIEQDTLFISGVLEDDRSKPAFSLPVGKLPIDKSVDLLRQHCLDEGITLEFSAIPECCLEDFRHLDPKAITELTEWGDYLYDAESLASLSGKKMAKKRNHVNRFMADNPDHRLYLLTPDNVGRLLEFMDSIEYKASGSETAYEERLLTRHLLSNMKEIDDVVHGAILEANGKICAFTLGDIKDDTLFIHVEKADREVAGSYEAINKMFAEAVLQSHPEIKFINREDDAGDEGLRAAKLSYHPVEILKKFNIVV